MPTGYALSKRIHEISQSCKICGAMVEDAMHVLFFCPHAKATWFHSSLGFLVSDMTELSLSEMLEQLWHPLDQDQLALSMSLAWHIWKARCSFLFDNKTISSHGTVRSAVALLQATRLTKGSSQQNQPLSSKSGKDWQDSTPRMKMLYVM